MGAVSEVFDVTNREIKGSRRTSYIALARQVVMYLLREELRLPLEKVAREVNRKDHTTVLHACEKIENLMEEDNIVRERVEKCRALLNTY
jgi:chromosomal replication initiator protein